MCKCFCPLDIRRLFSLRRQRRACGGDPEARPGPRCCSWSPRDYRDRAIRPQGQHTAARAPQLSTWCRGRVARCQWLRDNPGANASFTTCPEDKKEVGWGCHHQPLSPTLQTKPECPRALVNLWDRDTQMVSPWRPVPDTVRGSQLPCQEGLL